MPRRIFTWAASFSIPLSALTMISSWADSSAGMEIGTRTISNRQRKEFFIVRKKWVDHLDVLRVTPQQRSVPNGR